MRRENATPSEIEALLTSSVPQAAKVNRKFIEGDHWQNGDGWIGPRPRPTDEGFEEIMREIKAAFTSANRIEELCERHAGGVVGREPAWGFTVRRALADGEELSDEEEAKIDVLEAALTEWWNERGVSELLLLAVMYMAWGHRAVLRLYVPSGLWEDVPEDREDLAAWLLRMVYVDLIAPEFGHVHEDPSTKRPLGIVKMKDENGADVLELSYVDRLGRTFVEVVTQGTSSISRPLNLGRRITMFEMRRPPLITEQIRQQQKVHNLALSILPRNLVTGGFLERVMLNAQQPGSWELDPDTKEPIRFIPSRMSFGAGRVVWLEGIETTDEITGQKKLAQPGVQYREPIPVEPTIAAARAAYQSMLEEAQQAHVLLNSDPVSSGRSRVEARKDFEASLRLTKPVVERGGRWLLETALALTESLMAQGMNTESSLDHYRADFTCRLDTGALTPEEREQNNKDVEAGTMPLEYAMAANGIDDVDAALALINTQQNVVLNDLKTRVEIVERLTAAGASLRSAAEVAEMEEEDIEALATGEEEVFERESDVAERERQARAAELEARTRGNNGAAPQDQANAGRRGRGQGRVEA